MDRRLLCHLEVPQPFHTSRNVQDDTVQFCVLFRRAVANGQQLLQGFQCVAVFFQLVIFPAFFQLYLKIQVARRNQRFPKAFHNRLQALRKGNAIVQISYVYRRKDDFIVFAKPFHCIGNGNSFPDTLRASKAIEIGRHRFCSLFIRGANDYVIRTFFRFFKRDVVGDSHLGQIASNVLFFYCTHVRFHARVRQITICHCNHVFKVRRNQQGFQVSFYRLREIVRVVLLRVVTFRIHRQTVVERTDFGRIQIEGKHVKAFIKGLRFHSHFFKSTACGSSFQGENRSRIHAALHQHFRNVFTVKVSRLRAIHTRDLCFHSIFRHIVVDIDGVHGNALHCQVFHRSNQGFRSLTVRLFTVRNQDNTLDCLGVEQRAHIIQRAYDIRCAIVHGRTANGFETSPHLGGQLAISTKADNPHTGIKRHFLFQPNDIFVHQSQVFVCRIRYVRKNVHLRLRRNSMHRSTRRSKTCKQSDNQVQHHRSHHSLCAIFLSNGDSERSNQQRKNGNERY